MKIAVLVSGGVDSSVALRLLQGTGEHEITAFYLKIWLEDDLAFLGECPWQEDLAVVREVCDQINVSLEVISLQSEYWDRVVSYVLNELRNGRTPSPDIFCNERIKFGAFYAQISDTFDKVATGHYARVEARDGVFYLLRAPDPVKDQTYFLSHLSQRQLSRALFPIGQFQKTQVRALAQSFSLPNQQRKDSQGICFLGKISYPEFVKHHLGENPGPIVELESGKILGRHDGLWFHTIGQRQGLGLHGGPWYVVKKEPETNTIYISHKDNYREQACDRFTVNAVNWISGKPSTYDLQLKLRHGPVMIPCRITPLDEERWEVQMQKPDTGVAPGQFSIFYDDQVCLGGAMIEEV